MLATRYHYSVLKYTFTEEASQFCWQIYVGYNLRGFSNTLFHLYRFHSLETCFSFPFSFFQTKFFRRVIHDNFFSRNFVLPWHHQPPNQDIEPYLDHQNCEMEAKMTQCHRIDHCAHSHAAPQLCPEEERMSPRGRPRTRWARA